MMPNIGPLEIGIVLVVALVVFGPKRLPELGSSLGQGIRGFGKGLKGDEPAASIEASEQSSPSAEAEAAVSSNETTVS